MNYEIGYVHYRPKFGYETGSDWDGCWYSQDITRAVIESEQHGNYTVKVGYCRLYYTNHRVYFKEHKGKNAGKISAYCHNCGCSSKGKPKACSETAEKSLRDNNPECSVLSVWRIEE